MAKATKVNAAPTNNVSNVSNEITLNGEIYVPKNAVITPIVFTGETSVATFLIGKKVIVRSRNEGINVGVVVLADDTGIILKNARRMWFHRPADTSMSWYEGAALVGVSDDSKLSPPVDSKTIIEDYSATECTDAAFKQIMARPNHKQG